MANRKSQIANRKSQILSVVCCLLSVVCCQYIFRDKLLAFAQEENQAFEEIRLYAAQPYSLSTTNPKRVAVAKPEIVDVASVAVDEVVLEPKAAGLTSLFIWDDYGQRAYQLRVFSEDLSLIKQHADSLIQELGLAGIETKLNEAEGKLVLKGEVSDLNEKERLLSALASLKDKILDLVTIKEEKTLVQIDAQILEINRDDIKTLGIDYQPFVTLSDDANKKMNHITEMFAASRWTRGKLDVILHLLVKEGRARILSQPKLVCISSKEAKFMVGGEIPIPSLDTATTGSTTQKIEFKEYGIAFKINPVVKKDSNIYLSLSTKISEIDLANAIGIRNSFLFAPAFLTRDVQTGLYLKDNQSLVIAGLLKNKDSNTIKKFPFLGDVPILGMLWRSKDFQDNQTELVILLTPKILKDSFASSDRTPITDSLSEGFSKKKNNQKNRVFVEQDSSLNTYIEDIKHKIILAVDYPRLAREAGLKGKVKVRLRILADGQFREAYVIESSGSELLDNSTINSIKMLAPFPAFPTLIDNNEIVIDIPIIYN